MRTYLILIRSVQGPLSQITLFLLLLSFLSICFVLHLLFPSCSLGDQFTPIAAYTPTGPNAPVARVYEDPVELSMELLNKVDPFVDMVSPQG
jgi:hypothetical protein